MSRDDEDPEPTRPAKRRVPKPVPEPGDSEPDGGSTWKPASGTRSAARRRAAGESGVDSPLPVVGGPNWFERILFGKVSSGHLAVFCRQFGAYLNAGVDLFKSLKSLEAQFARTALGPVLGRVTQSVRGGDTLSEAMAREPQAFDPLFLSMMRVAEARGGVPETLRQMSQTFEARQRLVRQARAALIYPVIVVTITAAVCVLLTFVVLPVLVGILEDMTSHGGKSLPGPTALLIAFTKFSSAVGWWLYPLVAFGTLFGLRASYRTSAGKAAIDEVMLHLPVLGKLLKLIDITRFARTLGSLTEAGVGIVDSLDLTADVVRTAPFRRAVQGARAIVFDGGELSEALGASGRFPHDVISIVNAGEETGRLPESLSKMADDYEEQVTFMVKNLGQLIQPILTLFLGGIVLFVAVAFIMAYVSVIMDLSR